MPTFDFDGLFEEFRGFRAGVIGDVMLDTYIWGRVDRISPEAPVPVVEVQRRDHRIGGAGNVALNLAALGARVSVISVMGKDEEAGRLRQLLEENRVDTTLLSGSQSRITTSKTRVISRNQHMLRMDNEMTHELAAEDEERLIGSVRRYIETSSPRVIVLEDYNKGVLTERVITEVIALCRAKGILTAVDPKRRNFFSYRHAGIFKPNLKEVREALNIIDDAAGESELRSIHELLKERMQHEISLITLSEKGVFCAGDDGSCIIPTHMRNISDVSGAGDTVIAVASLAYAATGNMRLAASMANIAGGLVCEEVGTVAIDRDRLLQECKLLLS
jgi:rfaE bifunctional protein kinase chain/domain